MDIEDAGRLHRYRASARSEHWATALTRAGRKVCDKALPNDEARLRALYDKLAGHGSLLVVVDQPAAIGALAVAVSLFNGSNRPGFDGGSDDVEGSLSWDLRKYPDELRERATRTGVGRVG